MCFCVHHFVKIQGNHAKALSSSQRPSCRPTRALSVLDRICDAAQRSQTPQSCGPRPQLDPVPLARRDGAAGYRAACFCSADFQMFQTVLWETRPED